MSIKTTPGDWTGAIARARAHAPYLAHGLDRLPALEGLLAAGAIEARCGARSWRWQRRWESAIWQAPCHCCESPANCPTSPTARLMPRLPTQSARRCPMRSLPASSALALGKHGAQELNYSSDIDPILLYDPALLPRRRARRAGRGGAARGPHVVQTMSHVDGEGYVFRVDLRLRPASEVSPLAIPIEAALTHYESSALAWERAAFIRARACSGDVAAGEAFLSAIRPFVWRKSLDFGAIAEIGRLTARIRSSHSGAVRFRDRDSTSRKGAAASARSNSTPRRTS
jgi:glutamate-ammonia-ligase adenylyltransferase